jgi:hypothetical protein
MGLVVTSLVCKVGAALPGMGDLANLVVGFWCALLHHNMLLVVVSRVVNHMVLPSVLGVLTCPLVVDQVLPSVLGVLTRPLVVDQSPVL